MSNVSAGINNMKTDNKVSVRDRNDEKGAALIMALLVSFLMFALSAALILATSVNGWNFTDATAEQQAYNAAENGIQSVVDVLRYKCTAAISGATHDGCRIKPSPLYVTAVNGQTVYEDHKLNKVSFARAVGLNTSNKSADASAVARLSRVVNYSGTAATDPLLILNNPANYSAFNLSITDPDNTGNIVGFVTSGRFYDHDLGNSSQITFGSGANMTRITYVPKVPTSLTIPSGTVSPTDFGNFKVTLGSSGGAAVTREIEFEINIYVTIPSYASRTIRGHIETEATAPYIPKIVFNSQTYDLRGSDVTLDFNSSLTGYTPWANAAAFSPSPLGYEARLSGVANGLSNNIVQGTMSPPEPARIRIQSTGFGPRGAKKTLEAIILNNYFNGLGAPATVTMVGPPTASNGVFTFNPGNSNAMIYSGRDIAAGSTDIVPPIGVTYPADCSVDPCNDPNLDTVLDVFGNRIDRVTGDPANVEQETPPWLATPRALDTAVKTLYNTALYSYDSANPTGRVFTNTQPTTWGDNATGTGITFCDGDCELGPVSGGGILVVTGKLTLRGNFSWHGLIIVTGSEGIERAGGGHGTIEGNIVVAPYLNSAIAGNIDPLTGAGFLAPKWDTNGGGTSDILYNSDNQNSGLGAISNNVLGVVEK
jgi:hypothetical protein